jgi:outer membrane protein OmpA-like peptidoglycan-associated protein
VNGAVDPRRIAVVALASVLGGVTAGVAVIGSEAIEPPLLASSEQALHDAGVVGVGLRFDGREALLISEGADAATLAEAARVVERVDGVRWASIAAAEPAGNATTPVPTATPTPRDPEREAAISELDRTRVLFAPDSASLDAAGLRVVARVAVLLTAHPDLRVRLTGHVAIATGTAPQSVAFSERRAQAVLDELVAAGIDPSRLDSAGAGAEGVDDADGRRVDIEIVEAG